MTRHGRCNARSPMRQLSIARPFPVAFAPESHAANILVADDDAGARRLVGAVLAEEGYSVTELASGEATLQTVTATQWPHSAFDLVVTDLRMAGIDGLEVLRRLRRDGWTVGAILMTGLATPEVRAEAAWLGAEVLAKPFSLAHLTRMALATMLAHGWVGRAALGGS